MSNLLKSSDSEFIFIEYNYSDSIQHISGFLLMTVDEFTDHMLIAVDVFDQMLNVDINTLTPEDIGNKDLDLEEIRQGFKDGAFVKCISVHLTNDIIVMYRDIQDYLSHFTLHKLSSKEWELLTKIYPKRYFGEVGIIPYW